MNSLAAVRRVMHSARHLEFTPTTSRGDLMLCWGPGDGTTVDIDDRAVSVFFPGIVENAKAARGPLGWCTRAAIATDESADSVTFTVSIGDPRGVLRVTVRRMPVGADAATAGRLVLNVPHPGQPALDLPLTMLREGAYLIGG